MEAGKVYYFAYGSNMSSPRLRARVADARFLCRAELPGYRLRFHKIGRDGSAKCDAESSGDATDRVWGVVYAIPTAQRGLLDAYEGLGRGYRAVDIRLRRENGVALTAFCYLATRIDPRLRPFDWYREHVLRGAREHGLPQPYCAAIAAVAIRPDRDVARRAGELALY